jgi:hypothetical protein
MDPLTRLPDAAIIPAGPYAQTFLDMGIARFHEACRWVQQLPYGYNSDKDDPMVLFKEKKGSCTTKHAVAGGLAIELGLPVTKTIGIYAMTEAIVTGTQAVLETFGLPYVPMIHCFLTSGTVRVDLTEGNRNGKNRPVEDFLYTADVRPAIPEKAEYLLYRRALTEVILHLPELSGVELKQVLQAREAGIKVLKARI